MIKIYGREFSVGQLKVIITECKSISECARKLGFIYDNASLRKQINDICNQLQINLDHLDSKAWHQQKVKYPKIIKTCSVCEKEFETQQGHPKEKQTCSRICSNIFFSDIRHTDESNLKRSEALTLPPLIKQCLFCNSSFRTKKKNKRYCSQSCATKANFQNPEYCRKLAASMQQRIANGTHKGWSSRTKLEPSYAEKYVIGLLNDLGIPYTRELKVSKWFIDFADQDRKLALEIDGSQHNLPERKLSDENKDLYLINNGWQVLRIKWKKITKDFRNEVIYKIYNFLG
jgi:very-short-patch-repair endonuclease